MAAIDAILSGLNSLGFNNPSSTALFAKIAEAIGVTIDNTLNEISNSELVINQAIASQHYGGPEYYTAKALAFQYGDNLIIDPATLNNVYAVTDTTKQIVKQSAFSNLQGALYLKIATLNSSGNLAPLTGTQLAAFISYFTAYEIPGLPLTIISTSGDILNFMATVTYYSTYDLSVLQANIAAALNLFAISFPFNGVFFSGDLQDYIKKSVPGIRDVYIAGTTINANATGFKSFTGSSPLYAGYFNYISTILSNLTYVAI